MKKLFSFIVFLALFLLGISFSIKNSQRVELSYYMGLEWQGPLTVLLLITMLTGIVIGLTAGSVWWFRSRREVNKARRMIHSMSKELSSVRTQSNKDEV